ncbi:helix-turn-helix transcriptional regulator, partial [Streptomyces griseoaurantiacus]
MQKTSARLLALLSLLQTRRDPSGWSGGELAERLAVTPRTVRRDIGRLRELGYPVTTVKGPAGGYRLGAGTRVPPLLFEDDEAVALAVALHTAADGTAVAEDAARALTALGQV